MNWYGAVYKERLKNALANKSPEGWKWEVSDPQDKATTYGFKIAGINSKRELFFRIIVQPYSACCAFHQLNFFTYEKSLKEEEVAELMDHCLMSLRRGYNIQFGKKLVLNTVQYNQKRHDQSNLKLKPEDVGDGDHIYSGIYKWAKKQKHGMIDTVIVNQNTENIIHHLIVAPDVCNS